MKRLHLSLYGGRTQGAIDWEPMVERLLKWAVIGALSAVIILAMACFWAALFGGVLS